MLKLAQAKAAPPAREVRYHELAAVGIQAALAVALVARFHLLEWGFIYVALMALVGAAINLFLPKRARPLWFLALSLASVPLVLGWVAGLWVVALGFVLLGICHLPLPRVARLALLLAVVAAMTAARAGWIDPFAAEETKASASAEFAEEENAAPQAWRAWLWPSAAIWPVVGVMFMLRLIIYWHDLAHETAPVSWTLRIAYFFMLPGVACMLFPVVDFRSFERSHGTEPDERKCYQTGVEWMLRGVTQLLLYKLVYRYLVIDASDVHSLGTLLQYLYVPFLLYLRVSGEFHLYIGMLRLFGFALPETHHQYFLASSFTDFWRRTNIYWKDFMLKVFYYPIWFRLRHRGTTQALVLATIAVFVITWVLHAYLHFWIRNELLFKANDILFWTILGLLVVVNSVWEVLNPRRRSLARARNHWRETLGLGVRTLATFTTICVLWSMWSELSLETWLATLGAARRVSAADLPYLGIGLAGAAGIVVLAGWNSGASLASPTYFWRHVAWNTAALVCLGLAGIDAVVVAADRAVARVVPQADKKLADLFGSLRRESRNKRDYALQLRGYYENLAAVGSHNPELARLYRTRPKDFLPFIHDAKMTRVAAGVPSFELVPGAKVHRDGVQYSINRHGMRDREHEVQPPPGCARIAILGASQPMGVGVDDDHNYPAILETRLSSDPRSGRWEVLNFAVPKYTLYEFPAVLEKKALPFQPQVAIYVAHSVEAWRLLSHVAEAVKSGNPLPYDDLRPIVEKAGITPGSTAQDAYRLLAPYERELLMWGNRRIVRVCREHDIVPVWANVPFPIAMEDEKDVAPLKQMAVDAGFVVLDLADVFQGHDPDALSVSAWDFHPSAQGHELIAARLHTWLLAEPALAELVARVTSFSADASLSP